MNYKRYIFIAIFLFGIGLIFGLATPAAVINLLSEDLVALQELSSVLIPFRFSTFILILLKNASALLLSFIFSPVFCLIPVLALLVNGWLITFVSAIVIRQTSLGFVLVGLLPHGVFELPAFIMGQAAALSFGVALDLAIFRKDKRKLLLTDLKNNLRYLGVALVLLVPAAIIEVYVTPLLLT